ncbi:hypothetical protein ACIQC7_27760 [Kitasatospora sp. NPDC088556]|uniref:hypothetical protein n=1 Tax=Kitasatospora sp. NPDC088556 TaxID=3364076 RepID=UPI0038281625
MEYGSYTMTRNGQTIEAGYNITAPCDRTGCTIQISRGLDALCGNEPGGDDGCGGFFCDRHLHIASSEGYLCRDCYQHVAGGVR